MAKEVADMEENRIPEQNERGVKAALNLMLSRLQCRHCATTGLWKITKTGKGVRYLKCKACGRTSACSTNPETMRTYSPSQLKKFLEDQKNRRK